MKKMFLLFIFFAIAIAPTQAQFQLGLKPVLGLNFNIHSGSDLPESGSGFGLIVGAQADMDFSKSIGLIAGLAFYDNRSGSTSTTGTQGNVSYTADADASLAYFQIESLFKYTLPSNLYFVAGPVLGFNVESESEVTTTINTPGYSFGNGSTSQKATASIKDTQVRFELKFGAGYDIPLARNIDISPQLTFGYGLTNVVKDVKWKILSFQALVGVKFRVI